MPTLVNTPNALRFVETMSTKVGRNAFIGNADSYDDPRVKNAINNAHRAMDDGLKLVDRLTKDESRTAPSKHLRAKKEAETVGTALRAVHDQMISAANENDAAATTMIDSYINMDKINPVLLTKKMDWIAAQWSDPNGGAQRIREKIAADPDLAAILYRTDAYLIGMPDGQRMTYVEAGVKAHVPEAAAKIDAGEKLRAGAAKIANVIHDTHTSFYTDAVAMKMATRVED